MGESLLVGCQTDFFGGALAVRLYRSRKRTLRTLLRILSPLDSVGRGSNRSSLICSSGYSEVKKMESSFRSQLSSWQRMTVPSVVVLLACFFIVAAMGLPDKDATAGKPSRKHGPSERRAKTLNNTNHGPANNSPSVPISRGNVSQASPPHDSPVSPSSSPSSVANASLKKRRLIHGSKNAVTITKKEYLKKDWCETEPFQQVVEAEGCVQKRITNRFCYGQCNSFFIPKTDKEDADASSFRSCAYCTPKVTEWVTIVLRCPSRTPPFKRKRVQIVKQCKCMAVKLD